MFVAGLNRLGLAEPRGASTPSPIRLHGDADEAFSERLLYEQHVAAIPGSAFVPAVRVARSYLPGPSYDVSLEEALVRIERFIGSI